MQRIEAFDARFEFRGNAAFDELGANRALHFLQKSLVNGALFRDFFLQSEKCLRLEKAERQILQLAADNAHAEAVRNRRINVQRFARDALLLFRPEVLERAHVVQAVGQLDENDANVVDHRQQHFADVLCLAGLRRCHVQAADFGDALDETSDIRSESFLNTSDGIFRVFDGIVKKRGRQRGGIQSHIREDVGDLKKMGNVGIAGTPELVAMAF